MTAFLLGILIVLPSPLATPVPFVPFTISRLILLPGQVFNDPHGVAKGASIIVDYKSCKSPYRVRRNFYYRGHHFDAGCVR